VVKNIIANISRITNKKDKFNIILVSLGLFFSSILDLLGIGLFIPFIKIISDPQPTLMFGYDLSKFVHIDSENIFKYFFAASFIFFLFKALFQLLITKIEKFSISNFCMRINLKLYKTYLNQKINILNKKSNSSILHILQNETYTLLRFFENLYKLISEFWLIIFSSIIIIFIDPLIFIISTISFSLITIIYLKLSSNKISNWGKLRTKYDNTLSKIVYESFNLIKEIKLYDKIQNSTSRYFKIIRLKYKAYATKLFADSFPKIIIETFAVIYIIGILYILFRTTNSTSQILVKLTIFIGVSYKLIPALIKITSTYQNILNNFNSLKIINQEFNEFKVEENKLEPIKSFKDEVIFEKISFKFDKNEKFIFKNFTLEINKNEFIGVVGESGKGKSTLINIISGLIEDYEGEIIIDGNYIDRKKYKWAPSIGYVSQKTYIINDSLKNNICFSSKKAIDIKKLENSIKKSELNDLFKIKNINQKVSQDGLDLSGGQIQRIGIARALYRDSDILILDEPTSSLDKKTEKKIISIINNLKNKKTIILISHNIDNLKMCDKIINLDEKG